MCLVERCLIAVDVYPPRFARLLVERIDLPVEWEVERHVAMVTVERQPEHGQEGHFDLPVLHAAA